MPRVDSPSGVTQAMTVIPDAQLKQVGTFTRNIRIIEENICNLVPNCGVLDVSLSLLVSLQMFHYPNRQHHLCECGICCRFIYSRLPCQFWWQCGFLLGGSLIRLLFSSCLSDADLCLSECALLEGMCNKLFVSLLGFYCLFLLVYNCGLSLCVN